MNGKTAAVLLSGLLVACAQTQSPEATTPPEPVQASASGSAGAATAPAPAQTPAPAPGQGQAAAPAPAPAPAPTPAAESATADHIVNILGAGCEDLLRLSPDDRAAASMFYIGFQASRLHARTINVSLIPSIEAQAVTYCEENPRRTVAQVFAEAYSRTRR